jgi:hypothetical protein
MIDDHALYAADPARSRLIETTTHRTSAGGDRVKQIQIKPRPRKPSDPATDLRTPAGRLLPF